MGGYARDNGRDALVEKWHCCGTVNETGEGFNQLLAQARLQRGQWPKLKRDKIKLFDETIKSILENVQLILHASICN